MATAWQAVALGVAVDLKAGASGRVHSVFDKAANLLVADEMWTVLTDEARLSPFTICLPSASGLQLDVRAGQPVHVRAGHIRAGASVLDCRAARRWGTPAWPLPAPGLANRLSLAAARARAVAWRESGEMSVDLLQALFGAVPDALPATVARVLGRGPGLTPSGDDVVVGIMAVLTLSPCLCGGPQLARRLSDALAPRLSSTCDISRHLVWQAARGQIARPLYELGRALLAPGPSADLGDAIDAALSVGGTSGADACIGLIDTLRNAISVTERSPA